MDSNLVNYFTPLNEKAHKNIVRYLSEKNVDVTFKVYDIHSKSSFVHVDGAELAIFKKYNYDYETTNIYCTFSYEHEPYFFRAKMSTSDNYYLIRYPEKIYKIQRRANFRFNVPAGLSHEFKLMDFPDLACTLRDVSLGGCKVAIKTTSDIGLKLEQDIRIAIRLLDFGAVTIDATVAFTRFFADNGMQLVGLKFGDIESEQINELHKTLMQVDRLSRKGD